MHALTITSLNLQGFDNWESRKNHIINYLRSTNPDIIFFQEAVYLPEISPHNQAQLLNRVLEYPYELSTISRLQVGLQYPTYREGLVMLSKYPIKKSDTLVLKQSPGDEHNRIVQFADIIVDSMTLKCANVHFSITDVADFATPQLEELFTLMAARQEERIIAGDFNLSDIETHRALWEERYHSTSSTPYISFPSQNKRIDYALIPNSLTLSSVSVSDDGLSDHRALTVAFTI